MTCTVCSIGRRRGVEGEFLHAVECEVGYGGWGGVGSSRAERPTDGVRNAIGDVLHEGTLVGGIQRTVFKIAKGMLLRR